VDSELRPGGRIAQQALDSRRRRVPAEPRRAPRCVPTQALDQLRVGQQPLHSLGIGPGIVAVDQDFVLPIPDEVSFVEAACLPTAYGTALRMMETRGLPR